MKLITRTDCRSIRWYDIPRKCVSCDKKPTTLLKFKRWFFGRGEVFLCDACTTEFLYGLGGI